MPSVGYYRNEAQRCRELAAQSPDPGMATRWRSLASDYDKLADALDVHSDAFIPSQHVPMQQQPMQQQQTKAEDDKENR